MDVVGTQHMRDELNDSLNRRLARIDQIHRARAHWESHYFKTVQSHLGMPV